ncbi:hypothetical protein PPL_10439 [Heterostelium album PN500]|uniref:Uncharacterized protein n=1 Tax=Heterostelium pallidum (strain ATCC 26659 / Pp 5 / PN500) TaxID=670386 RepID=D3BR35_HETP5|nr:hypothetical protein PPL_10439 [Heterostelium album PN500]EFA75867.1 hypothetical protein PPL_10439 [Heterostelium album PN500]|eukprot:XP_020428001.1 hypothetical protein PPL_10439 [Heterostelium album PN500]
MIKNIVRGYQIKINNNHVYKSTTITTTFSSLKTSVLSSTSLFNQQQQQQSNIIKLQRYQSTSSSSSGSSSSSSSSSKKGNNSNEHEHLDSLEDSLVNHNQEEFQRAPRFFWIGVGALISAVALDMYQDYLAFDEKIMLSDIEKILNNDNPLERTEALLNIVVRAPIYHTIEKLFKNGIVDVLVKSLDDNDPTVQATAIRALQEFISRGYEVFGEQAVQKGASTIVAKTMLLRGMNCEAATNLWFSLMYIKRNQQQLLGSNEFISNLNQLAHSDSLYLQEVAVETFKILFANRMWSRYTNDTIYTNAKGVTGAIALLIAGSLASISLYPQYHTKMIDNRMRDELKRLESTDQQLQQQQQTDINTATTTTTAATTKATEDLTMFTKLKSAAFAPASLFVINQLFPVVGNIVLIKGWRNSRFIFLPAVALLLPYCLEMKGQ